MNTAGPMEHEDDLTRLGLDIGNDLMDQRPYDALLQPRSVAGSAHTVFSR
jgi:hypothetical protein